MARKKKEPEAAAGAPAWMATFSDLMNLLLCFFVLLFAFSSVDAEKFAAIASSMSSSFSVFSGGAQAIGQGRLISQGASQLEAYSEYYSQMGIQAEKSSESSETPDENSNPSGSEGENGPVDEQSVIEEYLEKQQELQKERTEAMYEEVMEAAEKNQIGDSLEVTMDDNYQYVRINMSGAILFDPGSDEIKKDAMEMVSKVGDILKHYDKYIIRIEGHTDNIPINKGRFESNMWLSTARATKVFEYLTEEKGMNPKNLEASGRGEYEPVADNKDAAGRAKNRRVEIRIYSDKVK